MAVCNDLPLDPQQVNESGWPWTLLGEAAAPARVRPGAVLVEQLICQLAENYLGDEADLPEAE